MSQLIALKNAKTKDALAELLGYKASTISYLLYKIPDSKKYLTFDIPKKNGGSRRISAPCDQLCLLQRKLCDLLQNCIDEINHKRSIEVGVKQIDRLSHGFKRNKSIMTNASVHRNRRFVFNIDLEGFFNSINFGRVRGFFISNRDFSLDPVAATLIAQIACFDNSLPQGSPCSPVISNLIGNILDIHINALARSSGCSYSRYVDDITLSTNKKIFPNLIAYKESDNVWLPGEELERIIVRNGFSINPNKTRMQYHFSRQEVTGLIVNKKINVAREYRHRTRAMVHSLFLTGQFEIDSVTTENGSKVIKKMPGSLSQLHGMLGYIDAVDRANQIRMGALLEKSSGNNLIYRRFLLYKEFFTAKLPVIICEGKTDNIYITQAIRQLVNEYPQLADIDQNGKVNIKVRRFRYTDASTGRILGIKGGAGDLKHFVRHYAEEAKKVVNVCMENPVILLVDNDKATDPIFSVAKDITKREAKKSSEFVHVAKNLYLMATPAGHSVIEDLFDTATKNLKIGNRIFSSNSGADPSIFYGKADFAYKIVRPLASSIDFSGFRELLSRFVSVINHHQKKMPADNDRIVR